MRRARSWKVEAITVCLALLAGLATSARGRAGWSQPRQAPRSDVQPRPTPQQSHLRLSLQLAPNAPTAGTRVVLWWESEGEIRRKVRLSFSRILELLERIHVVPLTRGRQRPISLRLPVGRLRLHALLDVGRGFWADFFFRRPGRWVARSSLIEVGSAQHPHVTLVLAPNGTPPRPRERHERCAGPRYQLLLLDAPYVRGRVGNPTRRRLCAYLPKSYGTALERRYPVVYLFPGYSSTDTRYLAGPENLGPVADALPSEVIVVGVDSSTVTGSSYFVDSPFNGDWARFILSAVGYVDAKLRTIPLASARAVVGQSTGGFNAVSLALRFPHVFTVIGASAPDGLDLEGWLTERRKGKRVFAARWMSWLRVEDALARPGFRRSGQMISYAAGWSPSKTRSNPLQWPVDLKTGRIRPTVWRRWLTHSPLRMLDEPLTLASVRQILDGRIFLSTGRLDEFDLFQPSERFSQRLRELGIRHRFVPEPTRHGDGFPRLRAALAFAARVMDKPLTPGPAPSIELGFNADGRPTPRWLAAIGARRPKGPGLVKQPLPRTRKGPTRGPELLRGTPRRLSRQTYPLTREQRAWLDGLRALLPKWWAGERLAVARAFGNRPLPRPTILVGNGGGDDGFTVGPSTIAVDLSALLRSFGPYGAMSAPRLKRLLSHEYAHLLTERGQRARWSTTPVRRAIWRLYVEGIGHYWSLSNAWIDSRGRPTSKARKTLRRLAPILRARLIALAGRPSSKTETQLVHGLAHGKFDEKWGVLPVAIWLAQATQRSPIALAHWIRGGPANLIRLIAEQLPLRQRRRFLARIPNAR